MTQPQPHRAFAEINGAQLYYEVAGAGHPLVMLHGHLLDSGQWDDQVTAFASAYQVIRYDARGFGQSTLPPAPYSHHEDLYALLHHLGIDHASLMGCSGGDATIIDFALTYPTMVRCPHSGWYRHGRLSAGRSATATTLGNGGSDAKRRCRAHRRTFAPSFYRWPASDTCSSQSTSAGTHPCHDGASFYPSTGS